MPDSWWLKVKRAQKHMVDINTEARRYASDHPYKFTRVRLPDAQGKIGYRMRITQQPDPMIAIMLGDFVHNLRSALDYIVVACVPRQRQKSASFPILFQDIWAKNKDGNFVVNDTELRDRTETAIRGLQPEARALVIEPQPYHLGSDAYRAFLGLISRLENADKHRQLITVGGGVKNLVGTFSVRNIPVQPRRRDVLDKQSFAQDGTIIFFELPADRPPRDGRIVQPSEVDMKLTGTAEILIKITRIAPNEPPSDFGLQATMLGSIGDVRKILRLMEPFVRR